MSSKLSNLKPPAGSRHSKKRVARGPGSGIGKTAGRGLNGQTSRSGRAKGIRPGFEGGQMPLHRRLPKRGFINPFRRAMEVVNIKDLTRFEAGAVVDPEALHTAGLVPTAKNGVKILGVGNLEKSLTVKAHAFSESARKKVEAAGGQIELIGLVSGPDSSEPADSASAGEQ